MTGTVKSRRERERERGRMHEVSEEGSRWVFFWNWKQSDCVETVGGLDVSLFHLFFFMCIAWHYGPTEARRGVGSPVIGVTGWL